ncbi:MAG TPA: hypothetical protein VJ810_17730 [Blastocatellia bacterium]|nr:hypothetical protein [Blastocatellia bacterium]
MQTRNSKFERSDGLGWMERPDGLGPSERTDGLGLLERTVWVGMIEDLFAFPTTVVWAAGELEAPCFLRIPPEVVRTAARQTSAGVAQAEPVRNGMRQGEAVQSASDEWVPRLEAATGQSLLEVSDQ